MKKIVALILAAVLLLSLMSACGKKDAEGAPEVEQTLAPEIETPETPADEQEENKTEEVPGESTPSSVPEKPAQENKPAPEKTPAAPEAPKEEVPAPEAAAPMPEAPKEESTSQLPSETPILPPTSGSSSETVPEEVPTVPAGKELSQIIDEIYALNDPILPAVTIPVDLNDAYSLSSFTGLTDASNITEAVASESMMGAQAYSLVLVRVKDAVDAQSVAQSMRSGIDQRKWICVNADDIRIVACGDVVMLCMIASDLDVKVNDMVSAFGKVTGAAFSVDIT